MGRQIVTEADLARAAAAGGPAGGGPPPETSADTYRDRLLKYIPAEVVTLYLFLAGVIGAAQQAGALLWLVFGVLLVGTPLYLLRVDKVRKIIQLGVATVSFAVWVFALGGPFAEFAWYEPVFGAVLLPLFTFLVAIVEPNK